MSAPVRLAILELFGARSARWRRPVEMAALAEGWTYHEYWGGEPPLLDPQRSSVVICADKDLPGLENATWFVLASPPQEVVSELLSHGLQRSEALHHASRRLAQASFLAHGGAGVASSYGSELALPGLGRVVIEGAAPEATPKGEGELAFYDQLPPQRDREVEVPLETIRFPIYRETDDGSNRINLLGRRRVVFHGPMYVLPTGAWVIRARISLDTERHAHVLFGWGFDAALELLELRTLKAGVYEIEMLTRWPGIGTAELTCTLITPALDGILTVEAVSLTCAG